MHVTAKIRFLQRKHLPGIVMGGGNYLILQQWLEGFESNQMINYADPAAAFALRDNPPGYWRDVPIETEE